MGDEVMDAGTGLLAKPVYGKPYEVYRCPNHSGSACEMCGGSGYRWICDKTECHEHGCSYSNCGRSKAEFDAGQRRNRAQP